jgi:hypothetical protein
MSELEARTKPHGSLLSRDRKNLRLRDEKCTGRVGGQPGSTPTHASDNIGPATARKPRGRTLAAGEGAGVDAARRTRPELLKIPRSESS